MFKLTVKMTKDHETQVIVIEDVPQMQRRMWSPATRVTPGKCIIRSGSKVVWHNTTDREVEVLFPGRARWVFQLPVSVMVLNPQEESYPNVVSGRSPGVYPYVVWVDRGPKATAEFAEGGSHPRMIVVG